MHTHEEGFRTAYLMDCQMGRHMDYNQGLVGEEAAHHKVLPEDTQAADMGFGCIELDMDFAVLVGSGIQVAGMEVLVASINERYSFQLCQRLDICYGVF